MATISTPERIEAPAISLTSGRRISGVLKLVASAVLISALATQIVDLIVHDALVPTEYFAYFTIESSFFNILVLSIGGVFALRQQVDSAGFTMVRISILTYAVVTGAVYNLLLRGGPPGDYVGPQWPNEVMHVWIPLFILADWLLAPGRPAIKWSTIWLVVSYPVVWAAVTLLRGAGTGWYPYPFLEPNGPTGYLSVVEYIAGLSAFIVALACGGIALSRRRAH
jgi:hypothetical protein